MAEFKVGDKVICIADKYNITRRGWTGKVIDNQIDGVIRVTGVGKYGEDPSIFDVASKNFDLYKSKKQTNMATKKKAATKKAAPKKKAAVAKKPTATVANSTLCDVELKDGDVFTANYKAPRSKAAPIKISGSVVEVDSEYGSVEFALCNKVVGDVDDDDLYDGFNYGIRVTVYGGQNAKKALESVGITNYAVCKDARLQKVILANRAPEVCGHRVVRDGDVFIFGCGDFRISKSNLEAVLRVTKASSTKDLGIYLDTAKEADDVDGVDLSEVSAADMEELLKM